MIRHISIVYVANTNQKNRNLVIMQVDYVKGSNHDRWHWCENCTQYPMYIYEKTSVKPTSDLCAQCMTKEENKDCHCEELKHDEPRLEREISNIDVTSRELELLQ